MIKNVANQTVDFLLLSTTDGSAVTTGTPAVYYKGDSGTQTLGTGTISHKGLGEWEYIPVQAETNFNHIVFLATLTGAFSQAVNIYTKTGDAYTAVAALNNISSADVNAACDTALSDYGANTITPPTVQEIRAEIDAYSTQLSTLAARLTATRAGYIDKLNVTGTLANSDTASVYQASLTGIATSAEIASIDALIDAIKQVTDKLSDTLEDDAGTYRFTTNALEQAPSDNNASAESIADAVWDELLSGHTVAGSSGNALATASSGGVDPAVLADAIWDEAISGHTTAGTFGAKNQKLVPSETIGDYVGSGGDATEANQTAIIGHLTAIKGATFSGSTDSLEALRNQGDAAWVTGVFPTIPTAVAIREELDNHSTQLSLLVSRLTALRAGYLDKLNVSGTLAHSDAASTYKADISGLATAVALAAVDTVVDSVKVYTDTLPSIQAAIEAAITDAHVSTDALLTSISADTSTDIPTLIAALHDPDTASIAAAVLDGVLTDLTDNSLNSGQTITLRKAIRAVFNRFFREVTQTASTQIVKNDAGSQVAVMTVSDDATTQTKGSAS